MKVELKINGRICLELTPETEIERTVVAEMRDRAVKGQAITLAGVGDGDTIVVSVDQK
jgi:hypothetical protein